MSATTGVTKSLSVATRTHGRVLVREAADPTAVIIGFHGYTENADIQMNRLGALPGSDRWTLVSAQGLHRFYRGNTQTVIASWMTRQDREDMIADNLAYFDRIVTTAAPLELPLVVLGFSQGAAMAFRAGVRGGRRVRGVVAVGGDVPPELLADPAVKFPPTLIARGERDDWYTAAKMDVDHAALRARNVVVDILVYPAGHEWTSHVSEAAAAFIRSIAMTPAV
jgi:predicted esterase